jgi:acetyl esterase/lipase
VTDNFTWLAESQSRDTFPCVWVQYSDCELLAPDQRAWLEKMRREGVKFEVDTIEGGAHLDAGIAFALRERSESSSWVRLLDAVSRIAGPKV